MAGRKTKLTKELIREAETLIEAGSYAVTVCAYLGIGETTWYRWLKEGEAAKSGLKREFWEAIIQADARAEIGNVAVIRKAAENDWRAAAFFLERRFPKKWGRKRRTTADMEHEGSDTLKIKVDYGE